MYVVYVNKDSLVGKGTAAFKFFLLLLPLGLEFK